MFTGLIAMAVFVGSAAADSPATIFGSKQMWIADSQDNFTITDNLYGYGVFGDYSHTWGNLPCPDGCGGRIYVVEHRDTWVNRTILTDVSSDGFETVG
ncbi:hypothetical protein C5S53_12475 [Methanophagales archaeon]|nr:hypothetical protein C5S53_12475 [Methanophagales archaeon]